jgi:hypothetical protein
VTGREITLDDDGRIVLDPAVREVVAQVLEDVWPGQTSVDDYLAKRLECGTVPTGVYLTVRIAQAAVRAATP